MRPHLLFTLAFLGLTASPVCAETITFDMTGTVYQLADSGTTSHVAVGDTVSWVLTYTLPASGTTTPGPFGGTLATYTMSSPVLSNIMNVTKSTSYSAPTVPGATNVISVFSGSQPMGTNLNGFFTASSAGHSGAWTVGTSLYLGNDGKPTYTPLTTDLNTLNLGGQSFGTTLFHYSASDGSLPGTDRKHNAFWFNASVTSITGGSGSIQSVKTPEPSTLLMVLIASLGVFLYRFWPPDAVVS
jgi:hypothetical protein